MKRLATAKGASARKSLLMALGAKVGLGVGLGLRFLLTSIDFLTFLGL